MAIDVISLSDADLATCVDEYVKRAVNRMVNEFEKLELVINVGAARYTWQDNYEIIHSISVTVDQQTQHYKGNNIHQGLPSIIRRLREDAIVEVTKVMPLITASLNIIKENADEIDL